MFCRILRLCLSLLSGVGTTLMLALACLRNLDLVAVVVGVGCGVLYLAGSRRLRRVPFGPQGHLEV